MDAKCVVSVPRQKLAEMLGVHPSRVSERMADAKKLGLLDTVRRGRPSVTAVYQGLMPKPSMVREPGGDMVRPSAPTFTADMVHPSGKPSSRREAEGEAHEPVGLGSGEKRLRTTNPQEARDRAEETSATPDVDDHPDDIPFLQTLRELRPLSA